MVKKLFLAMAGLVMGSACSGQQPKYVTQNNVDFAATIARPEVQLVDVRTADEFASGHIPEAVNIDVQRASFDSQAATLDKARPVAVYCRSGVRSRAAADRLAAAGFEVYNLDDGITRWNGKTVR